MRARWYDPAIGRFISPDTIVPDPTNPQSFNRYSYVLNNPLRYTDPTGHYVANFDEDEEGGTDPFEKEMPMQPGDDYAQAAWERYWWSKWTGDETLAEGYKNEVAPYLMGGWEPGGAWENWSYTNGLTRKLTEERDFAFGIIFLGSLNDGDKGTSLARPLKYPEDDWAQLSGMLRNASKGKGNFGIGQATEEQALAMGEAWVGPNYRVSSSNPNIWISGDGLRQFRLPTWKSWQGGTLQVNFEWRIRPSGQWTGNAHLDIVP